MTIYVLRRVLMMIPVLLIGSVIVFVIIQLPPGDFVTVTVAQARESGSFLDEEEVAAMRKRYGIDQPVYVQYLKWLRNLVQGNLGVSFMWTKPIGRLVVERLPWTLLLSSVALVFVYLVAIPVGVLAATHQYSVSDFVATFVGFVGLAIPNFLFALVFLWLAFLATGKAVVGLFSPEYVSAAWSFAKFVDLLKHLIIPVVVIGTAGTAGLIRVMRANLLDELKKQYVIVARAKGLAERRLLFRYPVRIAVNPILSTIGWTLPGLVNGELLTALVLGLPTLAPIFLQSLLTQDMYLAGSIVFILSTLTVIGTITSDLLLAWSDPRIREAAL